MTALLNWRVVVALALAVLLAGTHWKAYTTGKKVTQAYWDAERAQLVQAALDAEKQARDKEAALNISVRKVQKDYDAIKKTNAALAAATADSLLDLQATIDSIAPKDAAAPAGTHGAGGLEQELLGECARVVSILAASADRLESKVVGLQAYVRDVVKPEP